MTSENCNGVTNDGKNEQQVLPALNKEKTNRSVLADNAFRKFCTVKNTEKDAGFSTY